MSGINGADVGDSDAPVPPARVRAGRDIVKLVAQVIGRYHENLRRNLHAAYVRREEFDAVRARLDAVETEHAALHKSLTERPPLRGCGPWKPEVEFAAGDCATFDGSLWVCLTAHRSTGQFALPYWKMIVRKGRDGRDAR